MCFFVKYGTWQVAAYDEGAAARLEAGGFSPLTAAVLCSRGYDTPEAARAMENTRTKTQPPPAETEPETHTEQKNIPLPNDPALWAG